MGKASKWFRAFLGLKKPDTLSPTTSFPKPPKETRRWSFVKSYREKDNHHATTTTLPGADDKTATGCDAMVQPWGQAEGSDLDKHAIAVAAATAVVAEAAVAAAQAAAAVVRLRNSARCDSDVAVTGPYVAGSIGTREEWAAVKIQAAFRGCLVGIHFHFIPFSFFLLFSCYFGNACLSYPKLNSVAFTGIAIISVIY